MKVIIMSLSARRAWIEIDWASVITAMTSVALRKESVDRNKTFSGFFVRCIDVALRKESVDRNIVVLHDLIKCTGSLSARRAWIEIPAGCWRDARRASLSARRAWIEILHGVSLNYKEVSLSARRAWIEILH